MAANKKVFVSGCYDLLHSGHIEFFQQAAALGDLYVGIGSDKTIFQLKGRPTINTEAERLFMVQNVSCVKDAVINMGSGYLDFLEDLKEIQPDYLVVNEDGNTPDKARMCEELGIEYVILKREPHAGLSARSTSTLRTLDCIPYRIDLAGGWLDQPFVSKYHPGPVITISILPTVEFNERSGMASSTRRKAIDLWGSRLPVIDPEKMARILFAYDNPPGTQEVSGSQDSMGICMPGLNKADYAGEYWPVHIHRLRDELALQFVEGMLYLLPLGPRQNDFHVLENTHIDARAAKALADATDDCWEAILQKDMVRFGSAVRASFEAQIAMFPNMVNGTILELIEKYRQQALGWKVSGAGGGGYLILVAREAIPNALRIIARREDD
jgi:cytidyltransferase-like protein